MGDIQHQGGLEEAHTTRPVAFRRRATSALPVQSRFNFSSFANLQLFTHISFSSRLKGLALAATLEQELGTLTSEDEPVALLVWGTVTLVQR